MLRKEFLEKLAEFQTIGMLHKQENNDGHYYYVIKLAAYGDYDNSSAVERANYREIEESKEFENCDWLSNVTGGYGWEAITIELDEIITMKTWRKRDKEIADWIIDILSGLSDYPAISDESVSQIETELQDDTWKNCYESDFISELHKLYSEKYFFSIQDADFSSENLRKLFDETAESINEYWQIESGGIAYIDVKKVAQAIDIEKANNIFYHDFSAEKIGDITLLEELETISQADARELIDSLEKIPNNPGTKILIGLLNR